MRNEEKYTGTRYARITYLGDDGKNHSFWAQEPRQGKVLSYFISVDNEGALLDIHHLISNDMIAKIEPARMTRMYGLLEKV